MPLSQQNVPSFWISATSISLIKWSQNQHVCATKNILDLVHVLTSHPHFIDSCKVVAGLSDHEAVCFTINSKPKINKKVRRKVFGKADMSSLKSDLEDFQHAFLRGVYSSIIHPKRWGITFSLWGRIPSFGKTKEKKTKNLNNNGKKKK